MTTERLLGAAAPAEDPTEETHAEVPDRETVTPTEWAAGIRAVRRSTLIYDKGHLVADLDALADRIDATPEGEDVDDLIDEYAALAEQIKSGTRYVAEQRSEDWQKAFRDAEIKRLGLKRDKQGQLKNMGDALTLGFSMIAAQIVEPEGVTPETIATMHKTSPKQADGLAMLVARTNATLVGDVEPRDFSSRRSDKKSTKASSER